MDKDELNNELTYQNDEWFSTCGDLDDFIFFDEEQNSISER